MATVNHCDPKNIRYQIMVYGDDSGRETEGHNFDASQYSEARKMYNDLKKKFPTKRKVLGGMEPRVLWWDTQNNSLSRALRI